ncbi:hypothetical protein Tco_0951960 [Tanacetum coccineum]|uniref:MAK10-like protein n=1 Tax=Tanacetum coccineum TaxID=301880 RepID=A0ABQ5DVP7_9ASTR
MLQQHQNECLSEALTRFKDLLQKVPHHGISLWLQVQIVYNHVNPATRRTINQSVDGKLREKNAEESWALIEDLTLYDNKSWNDLIDFAKMVKAISLPQDVPSTSDPDIHFNLKLSKFEADFKQQQSEMTNKIDTFLKAINDRMTGALPSNTVKNPKLNINPTSLVLSTFSYPMKDPQSSSRPLKSVNAIKTCSKPTNDFQKYQPQVKNLMVNEIGTPKPKELEKTLEDEFKDLHFSLPVLEVLAYTPIYNAILDKYVKSLELGLLEETDHVFGLANGNKSYPVGIVKNVEVNKGMLKLLEDFYVIDMEKRPPTFPLHAIFDNKSLEVLRIFTWMILG